MALHTKKDFAKLCGMKTGNLTNYIKRGKVVQESEPPFLIDDTNRINLEFLQNRADYLERKSQSGETIPAIESEIDESTSQSLGGSQDKRPLTEAEHKSNQAIATIERQKKKADLQKKIIDTKKAQLEFKILQGQHVPVELIRDTLTELGKSLLTSYKDSADSFITEVSHRHKMPAPVVAELRGKLVSLINEAHHKAVSTAQRKVAAIVKANKKYSTNPDDGTDSGNDN